MKCKYKDEIEIRELVRRFEDALISRDEWKHEEHLVVALCYVNDHGLDEAIARMRSGIMNLLKNGFSIDLAKEMPYHETLTVFWMRTVFGFSLMMENSTLHEKADALVTLFDKDYPRRFYSQERLFSDLARTVYVTPDLSPTEIAVGD